MSNMENSTMQNLSENILQAMPEALIFADLQGIIRLWNPGPKPYSVLRRRKRSAKAWI